MNQRIRLQAAVDVTSLDEAVRVVERIGPCPHRSRYRPDPLSYRTLMKDGLEVKATSKPADLIFTHKNRGGDR